MMKIPLLASVLLFAAAAPAATTMPPSSIALSAGWQSRDCGPFHIQAPDGTTLRRGRSGGALEDRRFTLRYKMAALIDDATAQSGLDYREVPVEVDGRPAVLRSAEFPGEGAPYFLQLVVPAAVKSRHGWQALEIHGWFANTDRRWLAEHVVTTIAFGHAP